MLKFPIVSTMAGKMFSCVHLRQIDQLWLEYSSNKFGLSVQRNIYLDTGNILGELDRSTYSEFIARIGWNYFGENSWERFGELEIVKDLEQAQVGHLPTTPNRMNSSWYGTLSDYSSTEFNLLRRLSVRPQWPIDIILDGDVGWLASDVSSCEL